MKFNEKKEFPKNQIFSQNGDVQTYAYFNYSYN